ncbi:hypothetical protein [Caldimonas tepidiphila]|uniref:hypothetical protein n=1 Tax=Caldimonas tepidiphila TaxID=2315841 RepID=UPI000E5A23C8|nr:hypothetical protein [Caldimonas tepidiphila]
MYLIYGICGRGRLRRRELLGMEADESLARERARAVACLAAYSAIVQDTLAGTIFVYPHSRQFRWPRYGSTAQVIPLQRQPH